MNIIATAFIRYRRLLANYVCLRVNDYALAEDIVQDAFLRLLEMEVGVHASSVRSLLFATCRNLVSDHLRRKAVACRAYSCLCAQGAAVSDCTRQTVRSHDIEACERRAVDIMPDKRKAVYCLSRYDGMAIDEISARLRISSRTVEAHLFAGRKAVRSRLRSFVS